MVETRLVVCQGVEVVLVTEHAPRSTPSAADGVLEESKAQREPPKQSASVSTGPKPGHTKTPQGGMRWHVPSASIWASLGHMIAVEAPSVPTSQS